MMTPTSRTLRLLRQSGYIAAVVERWIPKIDRRSDLWHFGDILAVHPVRRDFLIVQTTSIGNISSRIAKSRAQPELGIWLHAGGRFEVHGWTHAGKVKRVEVLVDDLATVVIEKPGRKPPGNWQPAPLFPTMAHFPKEGVK
jgi:hypothetical protein